MPKKQKTGALLRFIIRDPDTRAIMRDTSGKQVAVLAYTPKAAKHQAKAMFQQTVLVEQST